MHWIGFFQRGSYVAIITNLCDEVSWIIPFEQFRIGFWHHQTDTALVTLKWNLQSKHGHLTLVPMEYFLCNQWRRFNTFSPAESTESFWIVGTCSALGFLHTKWWRTWNLLQCINDVHNLLFTIPTFSGNFSKRTLGHTNEFYKTDVFGQFDTCSLERFQQLVLLQILSLYIEAVKNNRFTWALVSAIFGTKLWFLMSSMQTMLNGGRPCLLQRNYLRTIVGWNFPQLRLLQIVELQQLHNLFTLPTALCHQERCF